jgi:hypothetical protein
MWCLGLARPHQSGICHTWNIHGDQQPLRVPNQYIIPMQGRSDNAVGFHCYLVLCTIDTILAFIIQCSSGVSNPYKGLQGNHQSYIKITRLGYPYIGYIPSPTFGTFANATTQTYQPTTPPRRRIPQVVPRLTTLQMGLRPTPTHSREGLTWRRRPHTTTVMILDP